MSRPDLAMGTGANGGPGPGGRNRRPRRFSRGTRIALITAGVLLFLAISGILARYFSAENVERDHEWALMQAEARGDVPEMLAQLSGCRTSPSCVATVRADAASLRRPGAVELLSTQSTTNHSLGRSVGETRVARSCSACASTARATSSRASPSRCCGWARGSAPPPIAGADRSLP
jgi:hypothetical protein